MESPRPALDWQQPAALGILRELTQALARADAAPVVYQRALAALQTALGVARASILTFDAHGVARFRAWTGLSDEYRTSVEGHCPWTAGERDALPIAVPDVRTEPSLEGYGQTFARENIRALAFIPLMGAGGCLGKFMLYYAEPHSFTPHEIALAEVIATQAAYAAERVATADSQRQQAARLAEQAALLDLAHDAILVMTMEGEIVYWSAGAEKLYGYTGAEARGRIAHELLQTAFSDPLPEMLSRVRRAGIWEGQLVHTTRDGSRRVVSSRWALRSAHDGAPAAILEINRDITEQKRHEDALRESEERLSLAIESTGLGTFDFYPPSGKLLWSEGTRRQLGLQAAAEPDLGLFLKAVHPDDRGRLRRGIAAVMAGNAAADFSFEYRVTGLDDGVERWIVSRGRSFFDASGAASRIVGISLDVTERRRTAERIENILSSIRESFIALDREWRFTYVNERVARTFGMTREQLVGRNIWEVAPAYRDTEFYSAYRRVLEERVPVQFETTDAEGARHWEVHAYPTDEGLSAYVLDVSDRWAADRSLRLSEERYRSLVQATSAVVFQSDARGEFAAPQEDWARYTGQPWTGHRGAGWLDAFHPDDAPKVRAAWEKAVETRSRCSAEGRLRHALSGDYRYVILATVPILDDAGSVREWVGALTDVHERRQMEARLRDAAKLESLGILAGGVAHDFNNLLTGILGNASLLQGELGDRMPARSHADMIVEASERAADLTRQMLAYSGRGRFFVEPLDVGAGVAEMRRLVQASLPKSVSLEIDIPPGLPPVRADAGQFQQLMMNLLINAGEAIPECGRVRVTAAVETIAAPRQVSAGELPPGEYVLLRVADTGIGMDAATLSRIFDPFFSTKFTGRGLGLAAALGIARGHGGGIDVASSPGQGALFSVYLPVAAPGGARVNAPAGSAAPRRSVLVIDDEDIVLRTARAALERRGYEVVTARDGREGLDLLRAQPAKFEAVLLDMTMPVVSGEDALRQIREIAPSVPVIGSSGYSEREAVKRFGAGLAAFLQKPYTSERLCAAVKGAGKTT